MLFRSTASVSFLSEHMAGKLGVKRGGSVEIRTAYPEKKETEAVVTDIIAQYMGSYAYASYQGAAAVSAYKDGFTGVYLKASRGVLSLIKELSREDYTIIVVTHNMSFAREVSEEVVFVEKGEILAKGSYDELVNLHNDRITQFLSYLD